MLEKEIASLIQETQQTIAFHPNRENNSNKTFPELKDELEQQLNEEVKLIGDGIGQKRIINTLISYSSLLFAAGYPSTIFRNAFFIAAKISLGHYTAINKAIDCGFALPYAILSSKIEHFIPTIEQLRIHQKPFRFHVLYGLVCGKELSPPVFTVADDKYWIVLYDEIKAKNKEGIELGFKFLADMWIAEAEQDDNSWSTYNSDQSLCFEPFSSAMLYYCKTQLNLDIQFQEERYKSFYAAANNA